MNPALASLLALLLAIVLSMVSQINVGIVAIALAWVVGILLAGMKPDAVIAGFPATLFLTLTGVTLLFACAETNGTLQVLAQKAVRAVGGNRRILPLLFFLIACIVATIGPGSISSVALVIPLAMAISERLQLSRFLVALMVANGANAGNLSPISSIGVIANTKMAEVGLGGHEWKVWFANFIAHLTVSLFAYFVLGGWRTQLNTEVSAPTASESVFSRSQLLTTFFILGWIAAVLLFKVNLGLSAFMVASIIIILNLTDEAGTVRKIPWSVILMVCGVSLLIAILEKTGGMDLFTALLARFSNAATINGVIAFITGAISTYSSTSGVVMPAFLPTAPKLVAQLGGGDALAIALSINVGSAMVDVSPLSTLGALCLATVKNEDDSKRLFRQLLFWGFSMTVVGAVFCQLFADLLARL